MRMLIAIAIVPRHSKARTMSTRQSFRCCKNGLAVFFLAIEMTTILRAAGFGATLAPDGGYSMAFQALVFTLCKDRGLTYVGRIRGQQSWLGRLVTASLSILAHDAQSCCMQAARMWKSRSSTCMWSARRESGTLCRIVFARLRSFRVVLCRPFSFLWRIISQKCPHQLFLPFLDRLRRNRCLRSSIAQRR